GTALPTKKDGGKWEFDLNVAQFVMDDDGERKAAKGLESNGGIMKLVGKDSQLLEKQTVRLDSAPEHYDVGLVFVVDKESADDLGLLVQYRDSPAIRLDAATRQKPPAAPAKKNEPEKKAEAKKTEETPKKIEPKKIEETPKK